MEAIVPITLAMSAVAVGLQFYKVARNQTSGVSSTTWAVVSFMSIGWSAYFYAGTPSRIFASIPMFVYAIMAYYITYKSKASKNVLHFFVPVSWVTIVGITFFSPSVGVAILAAVNAFMYIPQTHVAVMAAIKKQSLSGVSKMAWVWNIFVSVAWLGTAIHIESFPAIAANTLCIVCGVIIVAAVFVTEKTTPKQKLSAVHIVSET